MDSGVGAWATGDVPQMPYPFRRADGLALSMAPESMGRPDGGSRPSTTGPAELGIMRASGPWFSHDGVVNARTRCRVRHDVALPARRFRPARRDTKARFVSERLLLWPILVSALLAAGCTGDSSGTTMRKDRQAPRAVTVSVATVQARTVERTVDATGSTDRQT